MSLRSGLIACTLLVTGAGQVAAAQEDAGEAEQIQMNSAYSFTFPSIDGGDLDFAQFEGRPMLVVNTASKCGFTKQYAGLQELYEQHREQGLAVVGIPSRDFLGQEFKDAAKTKEFCTVNFGINFPMSTRQHVKGEKAHPFYKWAVETLGEDAKPKWNFHKILIDRSGQPIKAYRSKVTPQDAELISDIEALL